jgi:hypothetical protein
LIVGYDRTESARLAAAWAARQLQPAGKLVIVHACHPLHAQPSPLSSAKERRELGRALGTVTSELLSTSPVPVISVPLSAAETSGQALTPSGGAT